MVFDSLPCAGISKFGISLELTTTSDSTTCSRVFSAVTVFWPVALFTPVSKAKLIQDSVIFSNRTPVLGPGF